LRFAAARPDAGLGRFPASAAETIPQDAGAGDPVVPASEILRICRPFLVPGFDPPPLTSLQSLQLLSIDPPESSGHGSLTFIGPKTPLRARTGLRAALIVAESGIEIIGFDDAPLDPEHAAVPDSAAPILRVSSVPAAMAAVLTALQDRIDRAEPFAFGAGNRISPNAVVEGCLEGNVMVGAGAFIGPGCFIGSGTRIEPNAVIQEHCHIGRDCVIQSGAVIGCSGFGFFPRPSGEIQSKDSQNPGTQNLGKHIHEPQALDSKAQDPQQPMPELAAMPHFAGVVIGDGCWIGANSVVAAGVLEPTRLGNGCKLDSHVQIAHNVRLGDDCLLASQSGIAGSTVAGHRLRMGGASSVDGHLRLGDDVSIAACSGVTKDVADGITVAGFPARPIKEWRLQQIRAKGPENSESG